MSKSLEPVVPFSIPWLLMKVLLLCLLDVPRPHLFYKTSVSVRFDRFVSPFFAVSLPVSPVITVNRYQTALQRHQAHHRMLTLLL